MCQAMLESNGHISPSPSVLWEYKYDHDHLLSAYDRLGARQGALYYY